MARVAVRLFQIFSRLYLLSRRRWFRLGLVGLLLWWALDLLITLLTEAQWQDALGYGALWRRRLAVQAVLFGVAAGLVLLLGVLPLRLAASLPHEPLPIAPTYRSFAAGLHFLIRRAVPLSGLLMLLTALWLGRNAAIHWQDWLLFQHGGDWQGTELHLGRSVGFYVFRLAGWHLILDTLWKMLTIVLLLTALLAAVYSVTQLIARRALAPSTAWRGVIVLAALWFMVRAAGFYLAHFDLSTAQHPAATVPAGMNFTDWHVRRPVFWLAVVSNLAMALAFLFSARSLVLPFAARYSNRRPWRGLLLAGLVVCLLPGFLSFLLAGLASRLIVSPDEVNRENPFLGIHLRATRAAWQLDQIETAYRSIPAREKYSQGENIHFDVTALRVWDGPRLGEALRAMEPLPNHQRWSAVQLDRYIVAGRAKLVGIAAAEAGGAAAPTGWLNRHVQYIGGGSILTCDATATTLHGEPMILRGLPQPASPTAHTFYGASLQPYALTGEGTAGGVLLASWWQRFMWAWRLRDLNLLLYRGAPGQTTRLLFRRSTTERVAALAPFLKIGGEPYPVVADGRLVWLLDLLTATASYPASLSGEAASAGQPFNAARDSVKMVMDAADGRVVFYVASARATADPMLQAWQRALPQLVRPYAEMSIAMRRHQRYPRFLYDAQLRLLSRYHDAAPSRFQSQLDVWSAASQTEYALLPGWDERGQANRFVLQGALMSGGGRHLAALLRAGCDAPDYGRLTLLRFDQPLDEPRTPSLENRTRPAGPQTLESAMTARSMRDFKPAALSGWHMEPGALLPVVLPGVVPRVLLMAPLYRVRATQATPSRNEVQLWQVAIMDAATPDAPVGIGSTPRLALEQLRLAATGREALPAPDQAAGEIAALTAEALRLHDAAQAAAMRNWQQAGELWRQEREVLRKLSNLTQRQRGAAPAR